MKYLKMLGLAALPALALTALGAGTASATTLEVGGVPQSKSVSITATIKPGTSALQKDETFETLNTCTSSEIRGSTGSPFSGSNVTNTVATFWFSNCQRTVTVHKGGLLHIWHTAQMAQ